MIEKQIKIDGTVVTYRADGILHIDYEEKIFNLEESKAIFYEIREHCPWNKSPLLITGSLFTNFDADAKEFYGSEEVTSRYSAIAFLVKSVGQKVAANFFIRFNKPNTPTRAFKSKSSAFKWLSKYETKVEKTIDQLQ